MKLTLTDDQAHDLIKILKQVFKNYNINLQPGNRGDIQLTSVEDHEFILTYFLSKYRNDKMSINLREKETNLNIIRINIDPKGFHKNADDSFIKGNRLLIFSSEEWFNKNDGFTHVKAYNIPEVFSDETNIEQVFLDFLVYINVKEEGKISFPSLF